MKSLEAKARHNIYLNNRYKTSEDFRESKKEYQRIRRTTTEYQIYNKKYQKQYQARRRASDDCYRLANVLRVRMARFIRGKTKQGSAIKDLGCTLSELKQYLELQFTDGMTWENHGRASKKNPMKWNIDHRIPLSRFDLTDRIEYLKAVHFTNLQPLWAEDNLRKGNRLS